MNRVISPLREKRFPLTEGGTGETHGGMHQDHVATMPHPTAYPQADQYYSFYRMSIHAASYPDKSHINAVTDVADNPLGAAYTDIEQEMIDNAAKLCGYAPKKLDKYGSREPDDIHKISPVARPFRFSNPSIYDK